MLIIKNLTLLQNVIFIQFLIKKTLIRIFDCKQIFKFNIILIFNKFRIKFNNKNLIMFIYFFNIYKYHVFFFNLINEFIN